MSVEVPPNNNGTTEKERTDGEEGATANLNSQFVEFMENQKSMNERFVKLFDAISEKFTTDPPPSKKARMNDDAIELHPDDDTLTRNEQVEDQDEETDHWDGFNGFGKDPINHMGDGPAAEGGTEEHISGSQL